MESTALVFLCGVKDICKTNCVATFVVFMFVFIHHRSEAGATPVSGIPTSLYGGLLTLVQCNGNTGTPLNN